MFAKLERSEVSVYRKSGNIIVGLLFWSIVIGIFAMIFLSDPSYKISQESVADSVESVARSIGPAATDALAPTPKDPASAENENVGLFQKNQQDFSELSGAGDSISSSSDMAQVAKKEELITGAETEIESEQTIKSVVTTSQPKPADDANNAIPTGWYVQVGAFKSEVNADVVRLKFTTIQFPTEIERGDDQLSRVLVGPYKSEKDAIQARSVLGKQHKVKGGIIRNFTG